MTDDVDKTAEDNIISLVSLGDWRTLLAKHDRNKFLPWIWPNEQDLHFLAKSARQLGVHRVVSIGCGSGLLEWLFYKVTGMPVKGVEVDKNWWTSPHSTVFLDLEFAQDFHKGHAVATALDALLFCYFNNEPAFLDYLNLYQGPCLIVIGPGEGRGTHTLPTPFILPPPADKQWTLHAIQQISSGNDFIGIFRRT